MFMCSEALKARQSYLMQFQGLSAGLSEVFFAQPTPHDQGYHYSNLCAFPRLLNPQQERNAPAEDMVCTYLCDVWEADQIRNEADDGDEDLSPSSQ